MKKQLLFILFIAYASLFKAQVTLTCTSTTSVCPCGAGGSLAEFYSGYFNDVQSYFTSNTPGITRNDATINFTADNSWGAIVPPAGGSNAQPETYSTRWSGRIYLAAGTYTFWLTSDDGSWMWLGGNALATNPTNGTAFINNGGLHSAATVSAAVTLTDNCWQDFKVHFGENTGQNRCNLEYASTGLGITRQAVPGPAFCPCMSNAVLPVELKEFYGKASRNNVMLYWSTATEKNNQKFTVYKSINGSKWWVLGQQNGAGTSSSTKNYSMMDADPLMGPNYYYLEQTDADGTMKKFEVMMVDFSKSEDYVKLFPNPFEDKLSITSSTEWSDSDSFELYDALGNRLPMPVMRSNAYSIELNTAQLPPGTYLVKIKTSYQVIVRKLLKK